MEEPVPYLEGLVEVLIEVIYDFFKKNISFSKDAHMEHHVVELGLLELPRMPLRFTEWYPWF